jgi:hypothetical protein
MSSAKMLPVITRQSHVSLANGSLRYDRFSDGFT